MTGARLLVLALLLAVAASCAPGSRRPAWEQPPPPARDAPVVQADRLHRSDLSNGLRVLVLEDHGLPLVALSLTVRRGAGMVDPSRAGLVPFMAELMRRGAADRDALELAQTVDRLGARLRVSSDWDSISVGISGLSRDLELLLEILADVVLRPRFEASEARKARAERLASLESAKDEPSTLASWNLARALYPEHRYGLPRNGTPESVAKLDQQAARRFHGEVFLPNAAVLSASGDVAVEDFLARVGAVFGAWTPGPIPDVGPSAPARTPEARRIVVVDRPDLVQAHILIGHEGISRTDPDRVAAQLMNSVVGGSGFSSRLVETLRAEGGLTYSAGSGFTMRRMQGPFYLSTFTRVSETRRAIDLALGELERASSEPPDEVELRNARALAVGRFSLGLETSAAVMGALVDLDVYGLPEDSLDTYRGRVRATRVEDSTRMAQTLLHPERAAIVVVGPAESLVPQLEGLGPVEVVTP
jgi:zinc protease